VAQVFFRVSFCKKMLKKNLKLPSYKIVYENLKKYAKNQ